MIIQRKWAMPNKWTFQIHPIKQLLDKYVGDGVGWIDPFAGNNSPAEFTNDLNPHTSAKLHLDAVDFIKTLDSSIIKGCLFDPPYSSRQVSECYKMVGKKVTSLDTSSHFWKVLKDDISTKLSSGGLVISCCWNSNGFGINRGFELIEILLVAHGGFHNDTIVTVERKINQEKLISF